MISQKTINWLIAQKKKHQLLVKVKDLNHIDKWHYTNSEIYHKSKKFFKIVGIKVISNFYKDKWDQPIIIQNESGILGIIKNKKTNKYLLQAKVEPGNINKLQLAPTVQATKSNYTRAHGGLKVPYIDFFLSIKKLKKYYQSEQGFRYFRKFNANILITTSKNIQKTQNHYWFSKKEIIQLLKKKNIINMDTLSVFSAFLKNNKKDIPLNNISYVEKWLKKFDKKYYIKTKIIKLIHLHDWKLSGKTITHKKLNHFSIIGVKVKTNNREVEKWQQPIIKGKKMAFAGLIKTKINDTSHYLFRYLLKPGLKSSALGCTINSSDILNYKKKKLSNLEKIFFSKKKKKEIIYKNIISDEGGRFYHCQIKYCVIKINLDEFDTLPCNYIWLSYNQILRMIKNKRLDIESRMLFACDNIKNLK